MLKIPKTPLQEALDVCNGLYTGESSDTTLSRYVFPAIKLAISPLIKILPSGRYCIAGGVFRSLFFNELPTDIDIYPLDYYPVNGMFINSYIDQVATGVGAKTSTIGAKLKTNNGRVDVLNIKLPGTQYDFQIITREQRSTDGLVDIHPMNATEIVSSFDIIPACFGIDITFEASQQHMSGHTMANFTLNEVVIHPEYFYSVSNKLLMVNDSRSTFSEKRMKAERFYKYIVNYGFRIPDNTEMMKFNTLLAKEIQAEIDYE